MRRSLVAILLTLAVIAATCGAALALEPEGNNRKGKYLFRKHCRSCHMEGGSAQELSPANKVQADWQKLFADYQKIPCYGDWPQVKEKDVTDIYTYLYEHAKDSPSPAKCK